MLTMDIRHLEYFTEVAKQLNFTKAASVLHISQPSLSKTIKSIEDELGVPLFNRSFRNLELTDAGRALLHNAKHVLQAYQNLTNELNDVMNLKKGEIHIGIPPIIGAAFCSSLITQYKELYPSIDVILSEVGTNTIKEGIYDGSLDVGFLCNNVGNISKYKRLTNEYKDVMNLKKGVIHIGITPSIGAAFCSSLITQYKELYPSIDVILSEVGTNTIKEGIYDGSLDVGFVCNNVGNITKYE